MTAATAIDASVYSVYRELWISLVSLIRSYVAGYDLGGKGAQTQIVDGDGRIELRSGVRSLQILFDPETGKGSWELRSTGSEPAGKGTYAMGLDSTIRFSDRMGTLELDVAAEAFTARILDQE